MQMKLWLLKRIDPRYYDEALGFVIRASTSKKAREIANENRGDEGADEWTNHLRSTCVRIQEEGEEGVILLDFRNG